MPTSPLLGIAYVALLAVLGWHARVVFDDEVPLRKRVEAVAVFGLGATLALDVFELPLGIEAFAPVRWVFVAAVAVLALGNVWADRRATDA